MGQQIENFFAVLSQLTILTVFKIPFRTCDDNHETVWAKRSAFRNFKLCATLVLMPLVMQPSVSIVKYYAKNLFPMFKTSMCLRQIDAHSKGDYPEIVLFFFFKAQEIAVVSSLFSLIIPFSGRCLGLVAHKFVTST